MVIFNKCPVGKQRKETILCKLFLLRSTQRGLNEACRKAKWEKPIRFPMLCLEVRMLPVIVVGSVIHSLLLLYEFFGSCMIQIYTQS